MFRSCSWRKFVSKQERILTNFHKTKWKKIFLNGEDIRQWQTMSYKTIRRNVLGNFIPLLAPEILFWLICMNRFDWVISKNVELSDRGCSRVAVRFQHLSPPLLQFNFCSWSFSPTGSLFHFSFNETQVNSRWFILSSDVFLDSHNMKFTLCKIHCWGWLLGRWN